MGTGAAALMLVLLDSNIFFSALLTPTGLPGSDCLLLVGRPLSSCSPATNRSTKFAQPRATRNSARFSIPTTLASCVNHLHRATVWPGPIPRKHQAADPADSFLLDLIEAAQPDYAVTGDKRAGLLELDKLGRTKILKASAFCAEVLHL